MPQARARRRPHRPEPMMPRAEVSAQTLSPPAPEPRQESGEDYRADRSPLPLPAPHSRRAPRTQPRAHRSAAVQSPRRSRRATSRHANTCAKTSDALEANNQDARSIIDERLPSKTRHHELSKRRFVRAWLLQLRSRAARTLVHLRTRDSQRSSRSREADLRSRQRAAMPITPAVPIIWIAPRRECSISLAFEGFCRNLRETGKGG